MANLPRMASLSRPIVLLFRQACDFNGLEDRIAFDEDVVQDFDALMLSAAQDGLDVLITTGSGSVRLLNTDLVSLDSDMFIFS